MSHAASRGAGSDRGAMVRRAVADSFAKLDPRVEVRNPVMFLVWVSAAATTLLAVAALAGYRDSQVGAPYVIAVAVVLWFTVLFANFAEAIAEGRGKAQADSLRAAKRDVEAHRVESAARRDDFVVVSSASLVKGDLVVVRAGEQIPGDGEVVEGAASVDESAITGESAPVIREAGGDRSAVTGGTTVLSDWIVVRITSEAGESFLDKMIAMVEGAARKKTPNEIALEIFLVALSIIFILVTLTLYAYSSFSANLAGTPNPTSITTLVALLVCLAPTTIGALLSAIGIAGMSRLNQANVLAMSGRAIEAAGDVAKYFAIIPALFVTLYPGLSALNVLALATPQSAVLSAIIYNALVIVALIPAALRGVKYREVSSGELLRHNLLVWGLGGLVAPFVFIKLIDLALVALGLA